MKLGMFLLAVWVLGLAIMPCSDSSISQGWGASALNGESSHDHGDHEDDCSPFCVCDCCCVSLVALELMELLEGETPKNFNYIPHYLFYYIFDFVSGVWRPPIMA